MNRESELAYIVRKAKPWVLGTVLGIGGLIGVFGSVYTVDQNERAVVTRLGQYQRTEANGLHFKLPLLESKKKVDIETVRRLEIGFRTLNADDFEAHPEEAVMLTGDENIADVDWIVQYKVCQPEAWLFNTNDQEGTLKDASEAAMRQIVGDRSIDEVLTYGRGEIEVSALEKMGEIVDRYDVGVCLQNIQLQDTLPPAPVEAAFKDVQTAKEEKSTLVNEALKYANQHVPEAEGRAAKLIADAEGYQADRVNRARGDAARFTQLWQEYRKSPDVTSDRLYIEAMEEVLPRMDKVILDADQGVLPMLGLDSKGKGGN